MARSQASAAEERSARITRPLARRSRIKSVAARHQVESAYAAQQEKKFAVKLARPHGAALRRRDAQRPRANAKRAESAKIIAQRVIRRVERTAVVQLKESALAVQRPKNNAAIVGQLHGAATKTRNAALQLTIAKAVAISARTIPRHATRSQGRAAAAEVQEDAPAALTEKSNAAK